MARVPILRLGKCLVVSVQSDLGDEVAVRLLDDLTNEITHRPTRGVLIDISALDIVDSFVGRMLADVAATARILDARAIVVGMQPAVAITLVELGMSLAGVQTALNVERGMELLSEFLAD